MWWCQACALVREGVGASRTRRWCSTPCCRIDTDSNVYAKLGENAGIDGRQRYYRIGEGNHVDSYYDRYKQEPAELRPILPSHRAAFKALEKWVERDNPPPGDKFVGNPGGPGVLSSCNLGEGARYSTPVPEGP